MSERTPLYLVLLVVTLGFGLLLLREPLFGPYGQMKVDIKAKEAEAESLRAELQQRSANRPLLAAMVSAYGAPLEPAERGLAAASFYSRMAGLATACGLTVESISPRAEELRPSGLLKFSATVNLSGDSRAMTAYLAQLGSSVQVVGVDRLLVRRNNAARRPLALQATLSSYHIADADTRQALAAEQAKRDAARQRAAGSAAPASTGGLTQ